MDSLYAAPESLSITALPCGCLCRYYSAANGDNNANEEKRAEVHLCRKKRERSVKCNETLNGLYRIDIPLRELLDMGDLKKFRLEDVQKCGVRR